MSEFIEECHGVFCGAKKLNGIQGNAEECQKVSNILGRVEGYQGVLVGVLEFQ